MARQLLLHRLLGAFCLESSEPAPTGLGTIEFDWLIRTGLAPVAWRCWSAEIKGMTGAHRLQAADMTARVLDARLREHVGKVLQTLAARNLCVTVIKGVAAAHRYYPEPHLRMMGDVDLLMPADEIRHAESALQQAGFVSNPQLRTGGYDDHHHAAPLHHEDWKLWVELHRAPLKPDFVAATDPPFVDPWLSAESLPCNEFGPPVRLLSREFELAYLAAAFCLDLVEGFSNERVQRTLTDALLILRGNNSPLDWERIYAWSEGTMTGGCLLILLSYLDRSGLIDAQEHVAILDASQEYVDARTVAMTAALLDRYVATPRRTGWWARRSLPRVMTALLRKRPAWRNRMASVIAAIPINAFS